jgi:hypothetical protein
MSHIHTHTHTYTEEWNYAIKNEITSLAGKWMKLKITMLSKIS